MTTEGNTDAVQDVARYSLLMQGFVRTAEGKTPRSGVNDIKHLTKIIDWRNKYELCRKMGISFHRYDE